MALAAHLQRLGRVARDFWCHILTKWRIRWGGIAGDMDGYAVWKRILRAVEELQGTEPKAGEVVH